MFVELTVDLCKYLNNCIYKLQTKSKSVSELLLLLKPANEEASTATTASDGHGNGGEQGDDDNGKRCSISGLAGSEPSEVAKWFYCTRLTDWLYHVSWNGNGNGNRDLC